MSGISAMVTGKLTRDVEMKTSAKGTQYALLVLRVDESTFVRVNLFNEDVNTVDALKRGDDVCVSGALQVGVWEGKDGKPTPSLSMMANRCISPAQRRVYTPKDAQN